MHLTDDEIVERYVVKLLNDIESLRESDDYKDKLVYDLRCELSLVQHQCDHFKKVVAQLRKELKLNGNKKADSSSSKGPVKRRVGRGRPAGKATAPKA